MRSGGAGLPTHHNASVAEVDGHSWYRTGTQETHMSETRRRCTICGEWYPSGGYNHHARQHPHRDVIAARRTARRTANVPLHSERNQAIVAALNNDPYLTLKEVGQRYDITRERVRQIYVRLSGQNSAQRRPLKQPIPVVCRICGGSYLPGRHREHFVEADHHPGEHEYLRNREMVRLYVEDGLSSVQIGRIYDLNAQHVVQILNHRGVKMKPKGRKGDRVVREKMVDAERD